MRSNPSPESRYAASRRPRVRLRPLLLPAEHGGWGFLLAPVVIAVTAVPAAATWLLSLAALMAFLARQPLKIAVDDRRNARQVPRTPVAWTIAALYVALAVVSVGSAAAVTAHPFWAALALAAPAAAVQLWFDARGASRTLLAELAGALALAAVAAAAGLAAGVDWPLALSLWAAALALVLPAIVTVRERVRRLHGHAPSWAGPAVAHAAAVAGAAILGGAGLIPWRVGLVVLLLAARAAWDLRAGAPVTTAVRVGLRELVTGLLAAAAVGAFFRLA